MHIYHLKSILGNTVCFDACCVDTVHILTGFMIASGVNIELY